MTKYSLYPTFLYLWISFKDFMVFVVSLKLLDEQLASLPHSHKDVSWACCLECTTTENDVSIMNNHVSIN